jgi:transcriptional regulator with XRE-family HTH domain
VSYRGIAHQLDLVRCRLGLVDCQVKGELDSMESLAGKVGISRSTASRFFSGRPTSLAVTLKILDALHLTFPDVAQSVDEDDSAGHSDAGDHQPKPTDGRNGTGGRHENGGGR